MRYRPPQKPARPTRYGFLLDQVTETSQIVIDLYGRVLYERIRLDGSSSFHYGFSPFPIDENGFPIAELRDHLYGALY